MIQDPGQRRIVAAHLRFPAGAHTIRWTADTLIDPVFDVIVRGLNGDRKNPDVCDDASRVVLSPANASSPEAYTEQYAALLGAQLTGRKVKLFLSGCIAVDGLTRPVITQIAVF